MLHLRIFLALLSLITIESIGQEKPNIFDGRNWGIVLDHPDVKRVGVQRDVAYLSDSQGTLAMDIYTPPDIKPGETRPAIIFLNAIGETPGERKVKSWGTYKSWPTLIAANGYVGISMETDRARIQQSIAGLFAALEKNGPTYHVDSRRLGVYAASANVGQSLEYLMKPDACPGIKAAVMYYGGVVSGPYRKDLPVLFVIAEGDVARNSYESLWTEVLKNKAPWTIQMGSGLIHAFDSFNDTEDSRKVIKETLSFWKNNLEPAPSHPWPDAIGRETLAAWYGHDNERAAAMLKEYTNSNPADGRALVAYGHTLKDMLRFAEAEPVYVRAMKVLPTDINVSSDMIVIKYGLKKDAEARQMVADVEKTNHLDRGFYATLGMSLYIQNNHQEGTQYYQKAISINPVGYDYYNVACGYSILHQSDRAFEALTNAIRLGVDSKELYTHDADLDFVRKDKRFEEILTKLR